MSEPASTAVVTSLDGRWLALRRGTQLVVTTTGDAPVRGTLELPSADVDLALVGTPAMLAVVTPAPAAVLLYRVPELDLVARLELPAPSKIAAVTGPRLALLSAPGKVAFVRVTSRALAMQAVDPGSPVELAVGLDRDQVLMSLQRRLEVWDAAVNRPALRLQLQLPGAPRVAGAAKGHLWAFRIGDEDIYIYRLSDGRPFRHHAGSPILGVTSTLASPYAVIATTRGLVRLNCFAHSMQVVEAPWVTGTAMALVGADEDVTLVGLPPTAPDGELVPWRATVSRASDESRANPPGGPSFATAPPVKAAAKSSSPTSGPGVGSASTSASRPPGTSGPTSVSSATSGSGSGSGATSTSGATSGAGSTSTSGSPPTSAAPLPNPFAPGANPFAPGATNPFAPGATNPFAPGAANPFASGAANPFAPGAANPFAPGAANPFAQGASNPFAPPAAATPFASGAPANPFGAPSTSANPFAQGGANPASPFGPPGAPGAPGGPNPFAPPAMPGNSAPNPFAVPGDNPFASSPGRLRVPGAAAPPEGYLHSWRSPFVARGLELAGGLLNVELPSGDPGSELDILAKRFGLDAPARRTLAALYALYLVGYPTPPLARLAQVVGDWTEVLGRGVLGAFALLRHRGGTVGLRQAVADFLDGRPPRSITLAGAAPLATCAPGEYRVSRDSRPDPEIEADLAAQLGKIGVCHGDLARGLLEATLHGAAAVSFHAPAARPLPVPRAATLVLVLPGSPTSWIADLATLPAGG